MEKLELKEILEKVHSGELDIFAALSRIGDNDIHDLGVARIDNGRKARCGFPEFIYGEGKTTEQLLKIIPAMIRNNHPVLATRISPEKADAIIAKVPQAEYDPVARTLIIRLVAPDTDPERGRVLIITAGTSDQGVALEAKYTAELCGCVTELLVDTGVAGLHRLLAETGRMRGADVIIVVAGMEGALPSVVGGLVKCPIIAVPTSVGYGASLNGFTALFGMLTSCASGVTVVNIDNGFGAGCAAARIINR